MCDFKQFINEAKNPRPSALKKFKQGHDEVENEYIGGDIYDLSGNNRYRQVDKYYKGDGDGYIMDKNGNVYDVKVREWSSDAGRIVGGTFNRRVTVLRVGPNEESITLSGYSAVFSSPSSKTWGSLIDDIKDGMYLEDYLKYHHDDIDYTTRKTDWVKALLDNGAEEYTSVEKTKKINKENKYDLFCQRYVSIKDKYGFTCKSGKDLEQISKQCIAEIKRTRRGENDRGADNAPEEVQNDILKTVIQMAQEILTNHFGKIDCGGLQFWFSLTFEGKRDWYGEKELHPNLAWDIKGKKIAIVDFGKRKVLDRIFELRLSDTILYNSNFGTLSKEMEKILVDVSKRQIKNLGSESAYINAHYKDLAWGNGYWKAEHSMGEGKRMAREEFKNLKANETFEAGKTKRFRIITSELIEVLGSGKYDKFKVAKKSTAPAEDVSEVTPEVTNGPDKPKASTKSAKETYGEKAYNTAKEKMEKWHEGTRKQNLKNCNDGKLRMNYAICKELGFDAECEAIKKEAKSRGIVLESMLTLTNFMQAML